MVKSLRELQPGQELVCLRSGAFSRNVELLLGDDVLATLKPVGVLGAKTVAESNDGRWAITPKGLFSSSLIMTAEGRLAETARYESGFWRRGAIAFPDGRRYPVKRTGFWAMGYALLKGETPLVVFRHQTAWFKTKVVVGIEPAAAAVDHDLPVLILLGCQLIMRAIAAAQAAAS